jgi:DNA-binding CsgD family transcriptional regulator
MTSRVTVSERDLRTLVGIVTDHRSDLPSAGLPPSLLTDLKDQIGCDELSFFGFDSGRQDLWFGQKIPAEPDDWGDDEAFWGNYPDFEPCYYVERTGDLRSVTKISDFYSVRQLRSTGFYSGFLRPLGLERHLMLCLPSGPPRPPGQPGRSEGLMLFRGPGPDFSERDRALLTLLRPHLHQAYLDAERRRRPAPQLTPRHWELLRLVAAGHTNAQIARRLDVTEKTVGKHLENIYTRLQVSSRTAAVTRAFPDGTTQAAPVPGGSAT